jgi:hypothetical protein
MKILPWGVWFRKTGTSVWGWLAGASSEAACYEVVRQLELKQHGDVRVLPEGQHPGGLSTARPDEAAQVIESLLDQGIIKPKE